MPIIPELIVRVELTVPPDVNTTLAGVRYAESPSEEERVKEIVPAKPFREVKVTVEALVRPGLALMIAGVALTVKSGTPTLYVTIAE